LAFRDPQGLVALRDGNLLKGKASTAKKSEQEQLLEDLIDALEEKFGRAIARRLLGPLTCALDVYYKYRGQEPPDGWQSKRDSWSHCYVGCLIGGKCGLNTSVLAAYLKEIIDMFDEEDDQWEDVELRDIQNSLIGTTCAAAGSVNIFMPWTTHCRCCCKGLDSLGVLE
jgi:hypothetical protein